MKIYTKTGDSGQTHLFSGQRVEKNHIRVATYGAVDELNSVLGIVRTCDIDAALDALLLRVQHELFVMGADLAMPTAASEVTTRTTNKRVSATLTQQLEQEIDALSAELAPLQQFILPGGSPPAAHLHVARTLCRRIERDVVTLAQHETINPLILPYINRLSDWLFVLARVANQRAGVADVPVRYE